MHLRIILALVGVLVSSCNSQPVDFSRLIGSTKEEVHKSLGQPSNSMQLEVDDIASTELFKNVTISDGITVSALVVHYNKDDIALSAGADGLPSGTNIESLVQGLKDSSKCATVAVVGDMLSVQGPCK